MKKGILCVCSVLLLWLTGCTVSNNTAAAASPTATPQLSGSLSPATVAAGSAGFNLTVEGSNFSNTCVVLWNGQQRPTKFVSSTQLLATISPADILVGSSVSINVMDTSTGSKSNAVTFVVTSASAAIQHEAMLSWTPSSSPAVGYKVYRGTQSGGPYGLLSSAVVTTDTYSDTTVASGRTYFYVVSSVNSAGLESTFSNESMAAIPSP